MRHTLAAHPENAFLVLALCLGSFLCIALPPITGISYDDQIHYDRSLGLSFLGSSEYSMGDINLTAVPWVHNNVIDYENLELTISSLEEARANLRQGEGGLVSSEFLTPGSGQSLLTVNSIGYIPSAIGLWLARLAGLGASGAVILGRWANLIFYSIVFTYAIRIIPSKKILLSMIGLLPSSIFLASNYSYDPWVIAFLALGVALVFREIGLERSLTAGSFLSAAIVFMIGLCPKAIYFPVLGLFFLMPRTKFVSKRTRIAFNVGVVIVAIIVILTFILPLFTPAGQSGDMRGGDGVSTGGQIAYILSHPVEFVCMMGNFLLGYLSPVQSDPYTICYSPYIGDIRATLPWLSTYLFIVLTVVSILDTDEKSCGICSSLASRTWIAIVFLSSVFLVATSLYITFTPVGYSTVNGCQQRYLTPVIFLGFSLLRLLQEVPILNQLSAES